jgi:phytoene dehydrogenase-like protein
MKKKVIIVGGGIAGLSAGIYAQKAGLESIIYEKHSVPGGQCTGWMREGHYIDNCICWLTCAKEGFSLWDMWKDSGICAEGVDIHQHEAFYKSELNGQTVHLWRDLNRAEKEMLEISPEDKRQIKKFFKHVRLAQSLEVPVKKPLDMMNIFELISMGLKELKMIPVY